MAGKLDVGLNQKLYLNTGTFGSPTWTLITIAQDVDLGLETDKSEVKSRASQFKLTLPAFGMGPLTFGLLGDTSVTIFNTLRGNYMNRTVTHLAVSDQLIAASGAVYFSGEFYIYKFPLSQKLEEAEDVNVEADLAYSANNVSTPPAFTSVA